MRSLFITAVVVIAASALAGCRAKKPEPVPPPQSARVGHHAPGDSDCPQAHRSVGEISWFQGTLEEAFARHASRHSPKPARPVIRYLSAPRLLQSRRVGPVAQRLVQGTHR